MNNTTNQLLEVGIEDLERVVVARKTIRQVERKLFPFLNTHDGDHDGNGDGQNHRKVSQAVRNKISIGMKRRWKERHKEAKKSSA